MKLLSRQIGLAFGMTYLFASPLLANENIVSVKIHKEGLDLGVLSGGCTKKEHFSVVKSPLSDGKMQVSLKRDIPDHCKMVQHPIDLKYTYKELGIKEGTSVSIDSEDFKVDISRHIDKWASYMKKGGVCTGNGVSVSYSMADENGKASFSVTRDSIRTVFTDLSTSQNDQSFEFKGVVRPTLMKVQTTRLILPSKIDVQENFKARLEEKTSYFDVGATIDNDPNMLPPLVTELDCEARGPSVD